MSSSSFRLTIREMFQNKKVLFSFLRSFATVLIIPFLLNILFYHMSISEARQSAIAMNNQVLTSASERVDMRLQEVNNIAHEIVYSNPVRVFQSKTEGFEYPNVYRMIEVRKSLGNYRLTQNFVDQYFILFNASEIVMNNNFIYTYDQFFDQYLTLPEEGHQSIREGVVGSSIQTGLHPAQTMSILKKEGRYLMFLQPLFDLGDGYLCILIREDQVTSMFDGINLGEDGCVYVMNSAGGMLAGITGEACDMVAAQLAVSAYVDAHPPETAFTLQTANGAMLVNYLQTDVNGLTYVSVQPMNIILQRVYNISTVMLLCLQAALVLGFMLCFHQARQFSTPLTSLMDAVGLDDGDSKEALNIIEDMVMVLRTKNENLQKLALEHRTLLRSSFTSRLLRGSFSSDAEALRICQYVCPETANFTTARVLLFHLRTQPAEETEDVRLKLLGSMKVALKEVLERIVPGALYYDTDEETLALILFNRDHEGIDSIYQQLLAACPPYLRESVQAFGGPRSSPPLPQIARSFESARTAMMIHLLSAAQNKTAVVWADKSVSALQYFYPSDVRYRLAESITHGLHQDVEATVNELFHINMVKRPVQPAIFRLFVSELLSTAVSCLPLLPHQFAQEEINERLITISSAPAQNQRELLLEFFLMLTACAESNQNDTIHQIRQIINYMSANFKDSNLSLSSIAEMFSINASVLSTTFKQQTGKNLSAFLEDLRIQEAQRLIRTTNWTINRIAEEVGYLSANSFCRAFRRNTGHNTSTYKTLADNHVNKED